MMRHIRFIAKRTLLGLATALVASFLIYAAMFIAPTSPLALLLGGRGATPERVAQVTAQYHLDDPLPVQYWSWLTQLLQGDLGWSFLYRDHVSNLLANRFGTTIFLVAYASILILVFGILFGIAAALRGGRTDSMLRVVFSTGIAVPTFLASVLLITLFSVVIPIFPTFGSGDGFTDRLWHLTLPALALSFANIAYVGKVTRASVNATKRRDYVWAARARGVSERDVTWKHIVRNGLLPVITVGGLTIAGLIAGAVVVETAFALDGIGSLLVQAISQDDFAVAQVISLILIVTFVILSTIVDILYGFVDPRVVVD
jgi:peptide/nickel transport system permease protein